MMKMKNKKTCFALLAVILAWSMLMIVAFAANGVTTGVSGLAAEYTGGSWSGGSGSLNGSISPSESSGCTGTTYSQATSTLTLKNTSGSQAVLSFDYAPSVGNDGSATVDGTPDTAGGTFSKTVANNGTVTIVIKSGASQGAKTSMTISNISLATIKDVTTTFLVPENGSYTVDGTAVTAQTVKTQSNALTYSLSATPAAGYKFFGWSWRATASGTDNYFSTAASTTRSFNDDGYVVPIFVSNTIPVWGVGDNLYTDLTAAIADNSSNTVFLVSDGTLPAGDYVVPNGKTVLIPFDSANTVYRNAPEVIYNSYTTPSKYRELTMPSGANITVQSGGAICVGGKLSSKGQLGAYNGTPTGPDGRIQMMTGSSITVNGGGNLYCWGYIYGSGSVEIKSNGTVYEAFQVKDWRGGTATSNVYDYCFIFNQYYIQNIEVPMKVNAGATEKLYSSVNASSSSYPIGATLISGTNGGGMFQISDGYVVKDYNEGKDQLTIEIHGNVTMASLEITGVPILGSVSTEDYRLPVNDMNIDIQSGGMVSISQDLEILPGSEVTIDRGATFEVSSGKNVYLFDKDDWGNFTGSAKLYAVGYSVANGTTAVRTAANLSDARIDVNGILDIRGKLYTSNVGADITSTLGYDGTDGKVVFMTAPPSASTTIYEMENNSTKTGVVFYAPKLHNGDGSYSESEGTGTSTWKYDKDGEHWYRFLVDFTFDGVLIQREYYCENNDTVTYDASWIVNDLGATASNGTAVISGTDVNVTGVTADSVVTLTGTPAQYIPTFVLNEKQYSIYQLYTGNTINNTTTIGDATYYIVAQGSEALAVGTAYDAPTDDAMGVTAENHNSLIWNMSGLSYTSGDPYRGTVPAGETNLGPVYIYGFYDGYVAYNSYTDSYYRTLIDAFADTPTDATATITLLADCGTFEDEIGTQAYSSYPNNNITLDLNGHKAVGHINNQGVMNLELNGGTLEYITGATAAAAGYDKVAAVTNKGTMTIQDTAGGGKITADAIAKTSGIANYSAVVRNEAGGNLTVNGVTLQNKPASVNNYSTVLDNFGTASITNSTLTTNRGIGLVNGSGGHITELVDSTVSVTLAGGSYGVYNNASAIDLIDNCTLSTLNTNVVYNYNGGTITTLQDTSMTVTTPTTANVYAVFNYGGTITTMDGCTITGNSGINNRNQRGSNTIAQGYNIAYRGTIGTITDTTVTVGMYALNNGGTVGTIGGHSVFTAQPASAQVPWPSGTAALNGNSVHAYTIVNSNAWWYDSAVWKRTDTTVKNGETSMLQRRVDQYKTDDAFMPTIGTITDDVEIIAYNTSTSNSYGYFALQNLGVINEISGSVKITSAKHPNNAKSVYGYYALRNEAGGKINSIGSGVTISAYNYALANIGARYSQTDTTYSTTYLASGALKSGGLATDYDYTYADVSYIGSSAATITATSQYAILNYSKIGSITGTISGNYNVIVNAGAANTTTGIEGTTANVRAIEHRYFEGNDSSTTANEYRRYFEYTRNTTDGCYIGSINATVTATGAGYQAITNNGYIGTIAGTVSTPTGKATSSSTYYPLIVNYNTRQATLKQTEDYYIETNEAGATKYLREYTYEVPTIDTISCTATNPQDYTIQNYGQINNLTGTISGKTITVANETGGPYLTRKTIMFYSSASRFAASKGSSEVNYEYTKQPAEITNINGATIEATGGTYALRNYGKVGTIQNSTITSTSTYTIGNAGSTVTEYTSNRGDVLVGCVPNGTSSCALRYDMDQTINENEVRAVGTIDTIGAGNYFTGTYHVLYNLGRINTIDSGDGKTTIIYGSSRQAVYNLQGDYTRRTNTDAVLTAETGTTTNNYTYVYEPAYIGTIKNVFILGKRQAILNGDGNATYNPVTIHEIGEGAEIRTTATATYSAAHNVAANAKIELISGGVFITGTGSGIYGLNNLSTTYPIQITGGDFRGGNGTRALAINDPDNTAKYTYGTAENPKKLSSTTETATYHTLSSKVLTAKTSEFYYINNTYTVNFNMQGHGTAPSDQTVESGQKATKPTDPTADGYIFGGWYKEAACTNAWNFDSDTVTDNTILYAKWTQTVSSYTVTFNNYDGTGLQTGTVLSNANPVYSGATPTKPATDQYTYTFSGWSDGTNTYAANATLPAPTADVTYTAQFTETVKKYSVTFVDEDGTTVLLAAAEYDYGTPAASIVKPADPTKAATAQYTYTFAGWTPAITEVTANVTYTATYTETLRSYTVTFVDEDGETVLKEATSYNYGTPAASIVKPADPTKPATAQYTYTFAGWSPAVAEVTADVTYTATYTETLNKYTVTFVDEDGQTVLQAAAQYDYGTPAASIAKPVDPTKPATAQYTYTFAGWSPAVAEVTADATYTATYTQTPRTYTVQWVMTEGATEAEIKAGVDAVIAAAAQQIYNDAKTEGDMAWDLGWFTHEELVKYHLDAGGVSSENNSDAYIAKRIIEIVDNNSADFTAADALWDACKETIATDFAGFTGYTNQDTGTVYSGLTAEQIAALGSLNVSIIVLETDLNVSYGTTPSFDDAAPTKTGYRFDCWYKEADCTNAWDFDTDVVTGDTTIYAKWTLEEYVLPDFKYGTSSSNLKPASASYDIENGVSLPVIRYYEITSLTMMKGEEVLYSGADIDALNAAMLSHFETYGSFEGVTLNAVYTRQTYRMSVISKSPAGEQVEIAERSFKCGQSITLTAPATLTSDGVEYKFAGWWIGSADAAFESVDLITELKITYFSAEPGTFKAIAYYTTEGAALTTSAMPTIKVRDRYTERIGDSYRVCMTLELIAPNDPAVADKYTVSRIGFGYRTIAGNPFSETEYGDFAGWKSGTYVLRFDMPSIDTVVQTYGYAYYEIDGADWKSMVKIDAAQVNYSGESFDELKNVQPTENYWDVTSVQQ